MNPKPLPCMEVSDQCEGLPLYIPKKSVRARNLVEIE
jgi:hypothetical protein